jgi:hypothetical protein
MNMIFSVSIFLLLQSSKPAGMPEIPEASGIYYLQNDVHWIRLQPASIEKMKTKGLEQFVETGGYTNLGMNIICRGAKAALRLTVAQPIFFVRAAGSSKDAMLIRLAQKNDARTFYISSINFSAENKGGFNKGDIRKLAVTEFPDHTFSLAPEGKLSPGEYLIVFGSATSGFDFGIDKTR